MHTHRTGRSSHLLLFSSPSSLPPPPPVRPLNPQPAAGRAACLPVTGSGTPTCVLVWGAMGDNCTQHGAGGRGGSGASGARGRWGGGGQGWPGKPLPGAWRGAGRAQGTGKGAKANMPRWASAHGPCSEACGKPIEAVSQRLPGLMMHTVVVQECRERAAAPHLHIKRLAAGRPRLDLGDALGGNNISAVLSRVDVGRLPVPAGADAHSIGTPIVRRMRADRVCINRKWAQHAEAAMRHSAHDRAGRGRHAWEWLAPALGW